MGVSLKKKILIFFFKKSPDANISMKNYPACNELKKEKNITPSLIKKRHLYKTKNIVTYVRQFNYLSAANNVCKQFGPRSGTTKCRAFSGSKLFDTDGIPDILKKMLP